MESSASTVTTVRSPLFSVSTRTLADPPGRITQRRFCSQKALYPGQATHEEFHLAAASLVKATTFPRPYCHCAWMGSPSLPFMLTSARPARSAVTT